MPNPIIAHDGGLKFFVDDRDSLGLAINGYYEPDTLRVMYRLIEEGNHVLDVGANIGYFTAHLSRLVGNTGQVYAVEPNDENYQLLLKNIELNGLNNVHCYNFAVSDYTGTANLYLSDWNGGMHRLYPSVCCTDVRQVVPVGQLDELVAGIRIDFLKIDIEGFEYFALKGGQRIFSANHHLKLLMEYCPATMMEAGVSPVAMLDFLAELRLTPSTLSGVKVDFSELRRDACKYDSFGVARLLQAVSGKSNPDMLREVISITNDLQCSRPAIENLLFQRES